MEKLHPAQLPTAIDHRCLTPGHGTPGAPPFSVRRLFSPCHARPVLLPSGVMGTHLWPHARSLAREAPRACFPPTPLRPPAPTPEDTITARGAFVPIDPEQFLRALALAVRQLREERRLGLAGCRERCQLGLQTSRDWDKDTYKPSLYNLLKLANGLEIGVDELIVCALRLYRRQG